MEIMNEEDRKKIILESRKYGGLGLRRQVLRVHKNGAKFPVSKAYVDDEILDPNIKYTLILIPEVKIAKQTAVVLSYFHRRIGPLTFYSFPEDALSDQDKGRVANIGFEAAKNGFIVHQSSLLSSINQYFEIPSDWARGKKEILALSVILDISIDREVEGIVQILCKDFIEEIKTNKNQYKSLYANVEKISDEERKEAKKSSEILRVKIKEFYEKIVSSIADLRL